MDPATFIIVPAMCRDCQSPELIRNHRGAEVTRADGYCRWCHGTLCWCPACQETARSLTAGHGRMVPCEGVASHVR